MKTREQLREYERTYEKSHPEKVKEKARNYQRRKWKERPEEAKQYQREYRAKVREKVLIAYGGKCLCCGETDLHFLTFDHKNGGGTKERRLTGMTGSTLSALDSLGSNAVKDKIVFYNRPMDNSKTIQYKK